MWMGMLEFLSAMNSILSWNESVNNSKEVLISLFHTSHFLLHVFLARNHRRIIVLRSFKEFQWRKTRAEKQNPEKKSIRWEKKATLEYHLWMSKKLSQGHQKFITSAAYWANDLDTFIINASSSLDPRNFPPGKAQARENCLLKVLEVRTIIPENIAHYNPGERMLRA